VELATWVELAVDGANTTLVPAVPEGDTIEETFSMGPAIESSDVGALITVPAAERSEVDAGGTPGEVLRRETDFKADDDNAMAPELLDTGSTGISCPSLMRNVFIVTCVGLGVLPEVITVIGVPEVMVFIFMRSPPFLTFTGTHIPTFWDKPATTATFYFIFHNRISKFKRCQTSIRRLLSITDCIK
jgi:hypothetical protein